MPTEDEIVVKRDTVEYEILSLIFRFGKVLLRLSIWDFLEAQPEFWILT